MTSILRSSQIYKDKLFFRKIAQETTQVFFLLREWSGKPGSNRRPQPWQGCALPTELFPLESNYMIFYTKNTTY